MTKTQVEVITSVQRRRRWSRAEKERLVAAALEPGVVASEVAREAGIHASQLFRWRQELCKRAPTPVAFNPLTVTRPTVLLPLIQSVTGDATLFIATSEISTSSSTPSVASQAPGWRMMPESMFVRRAAPEVRCG